jgi:hypothetical protein
MRITQTGDVGIGTTPTGKLDVNGNIRTTVGSGGTLTLFETDATRANQLVSGADAFGSYLNASFATGGTADLRFQIAGSEAMRLNNLGNVGIGTASPGGRLEVKSDGIAIRLNTNLVGGNLVDINPFIFGVSNAGFSITVGSNIRQVINASGDVGIGVSDPTVRLDTRASNPTRGIVSLVRNDSLSGQTGAQMQISQAGISDWAFGQPAGVAAFAFWVGRNPTVDGAETMRITSGGNVGIGTTSPSALSGYKALTIDGVTGSFTDYQENTTTRLRIGGDNGAAFVNGTSGVLRLLTSDIDRIRINASGNVGVGTTTPWERLSIPFNDGLAFGDATYSYKISRSSSGTLVTTFADSYNDSTARVDFTMRAGAVNALSMLGSGNVGIGTTAPANRFHAAGITRISDATNSTAVTIDASTTAGVTSIIAQFGGSQLAFGAAGVENFRITSTGGITSSNLADAVGYKGLPQNSQTSGYTLALSDMGKHISITTGGVTIPANGAVAFPIGSAVTIFNNSGSSQTISITTDTLRQAGTANTGSRTLAQYGVATVLKVTSTVWVISGAGLS